MKEMKGMRKTEEIKDTGETEEMEVKEIEEMKGTRKTEEMKDIGETKELEESENLEDNPEKCSKCHQDIERNWCHPCNSKRFQNEFGKWTSEDREIDEFIQQMQLSANKYREIIEWIPFGRLENVTYLAKGGFGIVYKANWLDGFICSHEKKKWYEFGKQVVWNRYGKQNVCLKSFNNLTNKIDFLQEIKNQLKFRGKNAIAIYGITKNPTENEYMMVMGYAAYGSLRNLLNTKFENLTWRKKYNILSSIVIGLTNIHEMGLMHKDFHSGNIVNRTLTLSYITDFGLCKPVTENNSENIYGVIPYMAPETLSRGEYTQASDIYSFGMIMLEVLTSYPPYYNIPHNENLAMVICEEFKPEIKCEIPQFLEEIMEKCWNFEPLNRPTAKELRSQLESYNNYNNIEIRKQVNKQINVANKSNKNFIQYDPNEMHPEAIYTSRHLPFVKSKKFETHSNNPEKCSKCHQDIERNWCHPCNSKRFQNEFGKWTSEDREIDEFIQQMQLSANKYREIIEWIPFGRLENVTYLAKGGFGIVYKANWLDGFICSHEKKKWYEFGKQVVWNRYGKQNVCLKSFNNLTNKIDFLQEIKNQLKFRGKNAIAIYGITKNPTENEYMMVMGYAAYGSLRNLLNTKFENLTWRKKYNILSSIVIGLTNIHEMGLMHKDFHSGNIVNRTLTLSYITDFGLCKPVTENNSENIYGVIPYMAPETLSRGEYTQASDIYSFGMIMLEVLTSYPPYYNIPHNENLAMVICEEFKPEIKCEIPQFLEEIMEKCWNFEPLNRPTAKELRSQLESYNNYNNIEIRKQVNKQINVANKSNKNFIQYDPNEMHPEAIYTSRHLPFVKSKKFETHIEEVEENEIQEN
ncbi:hypothetical protein Glove_54g122 [Diversispora epigaea]|uniref:Protein kinase domain-containing protein n=1 Tax=Diversispora epigaea TaxID=1348612 RepID=A0A397JG86_9GLOM|nr:hypothetical protein Glove_54g122 [Diversispora epigaea]